MCAPVICASWIQIKAVRRLCKKLRAEARFYIRRHTRRSPSYRDIVDAELRRLVRARKRPAQGSANAAFLIWLEATMRITIDFHRWKLDLLKVKSRDFHRLDRDLRRVETIDPNSRPKSPSERADTPVACNELVPAMTQKAVESRCPSFESCTASCCPDPCQPTIASALTVLSQASLGENIASRNLSQRPIFYEFTSMSFS